MNTEVYSEFIKSKSFINVSTGITVTDNNINDKLYDFQKAIVKWACRKKKSAIFAECGLGKTFMQLEWARLVGNKSLIVAPLCVAKQTIEEANKIGLSVKYVRDKDDMHNGINITNYEMIEKFDDNIDAIVLDESSILKSLAGKTKKKLVSIFNDVPYKLCCTATPAPNDIAELGNHAEFLNLMTYPEMLASFFVHDNTVWRMKGYAHDAFYKWLASWAVCLNNPDDLGFDGSAFKLPKLNINYVSVKTNYKRPGELFFTGLKGIQDRANIRKSTIDSRVKEITSLISNSNGSQWVCWCGLNDEANKLKKELGDIAVNVQGSDSIENKESAIWDFMDNKYKVLITKPSIAGFGLNMQNASNMCFVGLSDSYEAYYQCIRRLWRFGQKKEVNANIVLTDIEYEIYQNIKRKETEANKMSRELVKNIEEFEKIEINDELDIDMNVDITKHEGKNYKVYNGDCVDVTNMLLPDSIDFSIYSPPFISLYTYSASPNDMGNSKNEEVFFKQYGFLIENLLNITKPGRNTAVHVSQIPAMLVRDGFIGMKDFRGEVVRQYQQKGWIYHGEIVIQKNPQAQAIRTHAKGLLFAQLKRDASWLRPGLADYILLFKKPGENKVPVLPDDISNNDWIKFAHPVWFDIKESNTLNAHEARTEKDDLHIAPLQLEVINRCIRLWSNKGETVLSPFAGIGSEGYEALLNDRKFIGIELKPEYFRTAIKNLDKVISKKNQMSLF